jgi:hypothetical protein
VSDSKKAKRKPIEARGFKYLSSVFPLLERLHNSGTVRDVAGNRTLFYDQYVALMLVSLFSPTIGSMRSICRASDLKKVQKKLGVKRVSLGSFSESSHLFGKNQRGREYLIMSLIYIIKDSRPPAPFDCPDLVVAKPASSLRA